MNFDQSFSLLKGNEGKFTNNPDDNGNWTGGKIGVGVLKGTKYGISAQSYPHLDIKNISLDQAKAIYLKDFWQPFNLELNKIPEPLWFDLFDLAVNSCAPGRPIFAIKILQRALGVVDDGIIGIKTRAALSSIDPQKLDKRFNGQRLLFIASLKQSQWEDFGKGWTVRIANNMIKD